MDPSVFSEHSLGAIVSRQLAKAVGFEKPYLVGLLHDLGYVVNMMLVSQAGTSCAWKTQ